MHPESNTPAFLDLDDSPQLVVISTRSKRRRGLRRAVNRDAKMILWSEGAEKLTGYLREDVVGRSCLQEVLQHSDAEHNPLEGATVPLFITLREGQLSLRLEDGRLLPIQLRPIPLRRRTRQPNRRR